MLISQYILLIGLLGFILNRKSVILLFIAIEIMLLGGTLNVLLSSNYFDDSIGLI
jgi:NADH:ubiquinone oxidoreductase subunit K